jgi:MerR family transcriptional regulator, mercuric resistance operon regulatory protein
MRNELTIGRLARVAGVHVETIRYYQRRGLLSEPDKPWGGYRRYPMEMIRRIHFIKRAQTLGFTLEEVEGLLRLSEASACAETRDLATRKVALIERKLADLAAMRAALVGLVEQCDASQNESACPIILTLAHEDD